MWVKLDDSNGLHKFRFQSFAFLNIDSKMDRCRLGLELILDNNVSISLNQVYYVGIKTRVFVIFC